ncbi:MAG: indolepyruvate oxidoreductase subunit beta [Thermoprotei archaeon]
MAERSLDMVVCGVGGQGTLVLSSVVAAAAVLAGLKVVAGETHGQAQRGGTASSHVRIREKEEPAPLIPLGSADVLLSLEFWEAMRYAKYLKRGGLAIVATDKVIPVTASVGLTKYPTMEEFKSYMKAVTDKVYLVDAGTVARSVGELRATNSVLLGSLARQYQLPFDLDTLKRAISLYVPKRAVDVNLKAFEAGLSGQGELKAF